MSQGENLYKEICVIDYYRQPQGWCKMVWACSSVR